MNSTLSVLKALSDMNRLKTVLALTEYPELCACQITELLQISGATTSRHLDILVSSNLVERRKEGRWVYYSLKDYEKDFAPVMCWLKNKFEESDDIESFKNSLKNILQCDIKILCGNKSVPNIKSKKNGK